MVTTVVSSLISRRRARMLHCAQVLRFICQGNLDFRMSICRLNVCVFAQQLESQSTLIAVMCMTLQWSVCVKCRKQFVSADL
jgi:hypothetical protein